MCDHNDQLSYISVPSSFIIEFIDFFSSRANLSSLTNLKHLHLGTIRCKCGDIDDETWVFDLLRLLVNPLDTLELDIDNDPMLPRYEEEEEPEDWEDETLYLRKIQWSDFRSIFSLSQFLSLRKLTVNLSIATPAAIELVMTELQGTSVIPDVLCGEQPLSEWPRRSPV